jgi:ATP-dependent HslUV protease ATP-binding subunit HslU
MKIISDMGLTPKEIVAELDKFIIGQDSGKRAVAIALRNRYRRKNVDDNLKAEIVPKNILMIGPTGVGKTEIARRLAKITNSPFIKVEATKFTEVGYVGRDVDSIIRDLADMAINLVKERETKKTHLIAQEKAIDRILDALVGRNASPETREAFRIRMLKNELDDKEVEIQVEDTKKAGMNFEIPGMQHSSVGILNLGDIFGKSFGEKKLKNKKMLVEQAIKVLIIDEQNKLFDEEMIVNEVINIVENDGIVFIDEIDKITSMSEERKSGNVSREGVQRDLLPLLEGTTVNTKYGQIKTDHILFIASGAFHLSSPSDLLPELQGRLPIRVELNKLSKQDIIRILSEPSNSLIKQYKALVATEGVELSFDNLAIEKIADYTIDCNNEIENIGARRLHTILEKLLEDISFSADSMDNKKLVIDEKYVENVLKDIAGKKDLAKFIL